MGELSNNTRKMYASLSTPKGRREHGMFMAQGAKCVADTIEHFEVHTVIATSQWLEAHPDYPLLYDTTEAKKIDLERITTLQSAPPVIAVYRIPEPEEPDIRGKLTLALDGVQDPGNMGTIMRVADWMGVDTIIASADTVDVWNPKVVQATMGAISRVKVHYTDNLALFLKSKKAKDVYGTFLDGDDIYTSALTANGVIVMGNEGSGIRPATEAAVTRKLRIPSYPEGRVTSESLNVAVATAITLAEFRRRISH